MLDRERVLHAYLDALVSLCAAKTGALFALEADRPVLTTHVEVNQDALDHVHLTWSVRRAALETGAIVPGAAGAVLGLRHGNAPVGLLYLSRVPERWDTNQQKTLELLAAVLEQAARVKPGPALARLDPEAARRAAQREQILLALRRTAGNVTRAAKLIGITRQAFYNRAAAAGVKVDGFRM